MTRTEFYKALKESIALSDILDLEFDIMNSEYKNCSILLKAIENAKQNAQLIF